MLKWVKMLMDSIAIENERQFRGKRLNRYEINKEMQADAWKKSLKCIALR